MKNNQVLLGRFSEANKTKPIPAATKCKDLLMQSQDKVQTLAELREIIKDETEKGEMANNEEEFFEKYKQLHASRTFQNRDPDYTQHTKYEMM